MSGQVGDLTPKQTETLEQFRVNLKDVLQPQHDDYFLLKWLRARSFDVKKSEKMLRDSLEWRRRIGADTLLADWTPPEVLRKYYPGGLAGFDKDGIPFWIDTLGHADLRGLMFSAKKQDFVKYKAYWTERMYQLNEEQSKKFGRHIDQCSLIFDMDGIGMRHLWKPAVDVFCEILCMFEANYPETLRYCFIINAPRIFPIAYNIVKPFLSEDTKKKIQVLGRKANWQEKLLEKIPAEELPAHWGGKAVGPGDDPYCKDKVCMGGKVPESYFMQHENFVDMSTFTSASVARGSSLQIEQKVEKPGSILRWQFMSEGCDIGFGVFRRTEDRKQKAGEMEEVVASERVNSHMVPEDGSVTCDVPGTYVLRFDNTYSWVRAKKVSYLVEVLNPEQKEDNTDSPKNTKKNVASNDPKASSTKTNGVSVT